MDTNKVTPVPQDVNQLVERATEIYDRHMLLLDRQEHACLDEIRMFVRKTRGGTPLFEKFTSKDRMYSYLTAKGVEWSEHHEGKDRRLMSADDVANVIVANVPLSIMPEDTQCLPSYTGKQRLDNFPSLSDENMRPQRLYVYNFESRIYVPLKGQILSDLVYAVMGIVNERTFVPSVRSTIVSGLANDYRKYLLPWNEPPKWLVSVGNGVYNLATRELEEPSVYMMFTRRILTDYHADAADAVFETRMSRVLGYDITLDWLMESFSNHVPERKRLLEEICVSAVTHHFPSDAVFFFYGKGGDGKSLFNNHGIAGMLGGITNVSPLNLSGLSRNTNICSVTGKMAIIGDDNSGNLRLYESEGIFKTLASHKEVLADDKYEKAAPVKFDCITIQNVNEIPTFYTSSDNRAISRRVVMFYAENNLLDSDSVDADLADVVDGLIPSSPVGQNGDTYTFAEHMLASTFRFGYRSDFNDVDRNIIREALESDDPLGQFVNALVEDGILDDSVELLPTAHLYAAYLDWFKVHVRNGHYLGERSFFGKIVSKLSDYGFVQSDKRLRLTHPDVASKYSPEMFNGFCSGREFKETVAASGNKLTFLVRKRTPPTSGAHGPKDMRRFDVDCTLAEYMGVTTFARKTMSADERAVVDAYDAYNSALMHGKGQDSCVTASPHTAATPVLDDLRANSAVSGHIPPETYESAADEVRSLAEPSTDPDVTPVPPPVLSKLTVILSNRGTNGMMGELRRIEGVGDPTLADCARLLSELADIARKYPPSKIQKETP